MQVHSKLIEVACPRCGLEKTIGVPETLFSQKKYGHIKIQVPQGVVCQDHVFVVFLDVEGRIIGYQTVDLSISSTPETAPKEEISLEDGKTISLKRFIMMVGYSCFAGLIHAKLFNYPSFLIMNSEHKLNIDVINNVLDEIVPEIYKNKRSLKIIDYNDRVFPTATFFYALVQNQRKTAFLMNPHKHVVQMPWKTGLELEKTMIASAINKEDQNEHLKFLAFYISKFLEDVDKTLKILETVKKASKKELVKKLKEIAITSTITKNYVNSIEEYIHRRVSPQVARKVHD
ncbi:MAG: hypothetical protein ACFE9N_06600 [Promethearchaeota archaeon]